MVKLKIKVLFLSTNFKIWMILFQLMIKMCVILLWNCIKYSLAIPFDIMKDVFPVRGRRHIDFVKLTGILTAKTLPPSYLLPSDLYTMTLNYGELRKCADKCGRDHFYYFSNSYATHVPYNIQVPCNM